MSTSKTLSQIRMASGLVLPLILGCGSLGLWIVRPSPAEAAPAPVPRVQNLAKQEPKAAPASPVVPAAETKPDEMVEFRGRILDPEGKPLPAAKVYLDYFVWAEYRNRVPPRLRATTGADGRFRFNVAKSYFDRPLVLERWQYATVFALSERLGIGFSDSDEPDSDRDLTIRMPRDNAPLAGRLVDLEGRPVADATVRVTAIAAPPSGDLTPFLSAGLEGENLRAQGEVSAQGCGRSPPLSAHPAGEKWA